MFFCKYFCNPLPFLLISPPPSFSLSLPLSPLLLPFFLSPLPLTQALRFLFPLLSIFSPTLLLQTTRGYAAPIPLSFKSGKSLMPEKIRPRLLNPVSWFSSRDEETLIHHYRFEKQVANGAGPLSPDSLEKALSTHNKAIVSQFPLGQPLWPISISMPCARQI